jgi:carbon monoxide dehydrogenase subunit G
MIRRASGTLSVHEHTREPWLQRHMFEFRHRVPIRRPPQDVFALLTRFEDVPKFVPQVVSAEQTSVGELGVGTIFVQRGRLFGRTVETPTVVTTFEPPSRFGYRTDGGPVPYQAIYDLLPRDAHTLLEATVTVRMRGAVRALEPLVGRGVRRVYLRNLECLRELLEH